MIDENALHGTGRGIGSGGGGITLQIEKEAETAGALKAYIYLIMDAQLNIQMECSVLPCTEKLLRILEPYTVLFVALTGVRKTQLALDLLEREYLGHFNFIIVLCPTLRHNEMYH